MRHHSIDMLVVTDKTAQQDAGHRYTFTLESVQGNIQTISPSQTVHLTCAPQRLARQLTDGPRYIGTTPTKKGLRLLPQQANRASQVGPACTVAPASVLSSRLRGGGRGHGCACIPGPLAVSRSARHADLHASDWRLCDGSANVSKSQQKSSSSKAVTR